MCIRDSLQAVLLQVQPLDLQAVLLQVQPLDLQAILPLVQPLDQQSVLPLDLLLDQTHLDIQAVGMEPRFGATFLEMGNF